MKISIVIAILDSHEVVRRQIAHFKKMDLPDSVEFIFVDDGSEPPLTGEMRNLTFYYTHDKRPWTQGLARNLGATNAKGEYPATLWNWQGRCSRLIRTTNMSGFFGENHALSWWG